jgi:hypothetical protein
MKISQKNWSNLIIFIQFDKTLKVVTSVKLLSSYPQIDHKIDSYFMCHFSMYITSQYICYGWKYGKIILKDVVQCPKSNF